MVSPKDPTDYKGTLQPYVPIVRFPRAPRAPLSASADFKNPLTGKNYVIGQEWSDSSTGDIYKLRAITANLGDWFLLSSSSGGPTVDFAVPLGDSPVFPTAAGLMTFTSSGGTINITGTAASNSINFDLVGGTGAVDSVDVDFNTAPGTDPVVPDAAGLISVYGNTVTNATNANAPVATHSRAANQFQVDVQLATAVTATPADPFDVGLASFDDSQFTVTANGFVQLVGGGGGPAYVATNVDGNMAPGTDPVLADGSGEITVTGAQVAAGTIGANVIDTYSGAANTYAVRVQQADTAAAKDTTLNGVAHFDSAYFTDDEGFISTTGTGLGETITGDSGGALSPTAGNWNIVGGTGVSTSGTGSTLTITNTDPGSGGGSGSYYLFDDFTESEHYDAAASATYRATSNYFWVGNASGLTIVGETNPSLLLNHPGIITVTVSNGVNAQGVIVEDSRTVIGDGTTVIESLVRIPQLSTAGRQLYIYSGLYVRTGIFTTITDGVYLYYTHSVSSGNWTAECKVSSVATTVDTGVAVAINTWYKLRIEINAAASSVEFFVDGVSVATINTNIPTSTALSTMLGIEAPNTGSGQVIGYFDYILTQKTLTTAR